MRPLRVLVADDDEAIRHLLSAALPFSERPAKVVGEARDGEEAINRAADLQPDVIILDHRMPVRTGADSVEDLKRVSPGSKIVMFSAYVDAPDCEQAITDVSKKHHIPVVSKSGIGGLESALALL